MPDKEGNTWPYNGMSADNHWVSLAASGEVSLTIRAIGIEGERAELLPGRPGTTATVEADGSVQVKLTLAPEQPDYSFVRINGKHGDTHPLFIFADPPASRCGTSSFSRGTTAPTASAAVAASDWWSTVFSR